MLPRAYRNYTKLIPQWSIRTTGGLVNHPSQGNNTFIQPVRDSISVCKNTIDEYLYLILINSCPNSYYVLSEEQITITNGLLIATIKNKDKVNDQFEIINVNTTPI